jgi:hypothetical protein
LQNQGLENLRIRQALTTNQFPRSLELPPASRGKAGVRMAKNAHQFYMKKRMAYICSIRKELYDNPELGTCRKCGHTYHHGETCGNCHSAKIGKTMKPTGTTMKIAMEIFEMGFRAGEDFGGKRALQYPVVRAAMRLFNALPYEEKKKLVLSFCDQKANF